MPPTGGPVAPRGGVVLVIPAHDEARPIGAVIGAAAADGASGGRPGAVVVVDDGSTDDTAVDGAARRAPRWSPTAQPRLGAAVRHGPGGGRRRRPAVRGVLRRRRRVRPRGAGPPRRADPRPGGADYVVGSRFAGEIRRMRPHRRARQPRAHPLGALDDPAAGSPTGRAATGRCRRAAAEAEIVHDYNYAQVLTARPARPRASATPRCRSPTGSATAAASFVRLGPLPARVVPAVAARDSRRSVLHDVIGEGPARTRGPARRGRTSRRAASVAERRPSPSAARGGCCRGRTAPGGRTDSDRFGPVEPTRRCASVRSIAEAGTRGRRGSRRTTSPPMGAGDGQAQRGPAHRPPAGPARRRRRPHVVTERRTAARRTARCGRPGRPPMAR